MTDLFPGESGAALAAHAVNNLGQVAGTNHWSPTRGGLSGCFWDEGSVTELGLNTAAYGINDSGQVVGCLINGTSTAFLWDPVGGMRDLGYIPSVGTGWTEARAINNLAQVVGFDGVPGEIAGFGGEAFLWQDGVGMRGLGSMIAGGMSRANGINNASQVVGVAQTQHGRAAFVWDSAAGMVDLGALGSTGEGTDLSEAFGINDVGQIVGKSNGRAFLWEGGHMEDLTGLLDDSGSAWRELDCAYGINANGWIVGEGTTWYTDAWGTHEVEHAFLAAPTAVPEPFALGLCAAGLGLALRRMRKGS